VSILVSNDELVTVRDAMRGLNRMVERLEAGDQDQYVLMHRGRMVAVLTPIRDLEHEIEGVEMTGNEAP
jgi:antitoxin (DNA-binding transcriptional repressor) of toxin-antitoxin stability system